MLGGFIHPFHSTITAPALKIGGAVFEAWHIQAIKSIKHVS